MRVLTFTTLFPNGSFPHRGIFVRERTRGVAAYCDVEVVAPVPYAPALPGSARMRRLASVPVVETIAGLRVHHPRYFSVPGEWPWLKPATIAAAGWSVVRRLHAERPFELVDSHFAHPDAAAAATVAGRLGLPLVVSLRGSDIHRDLQRPRLRPRILKTLAQATAVIAVAQPLAEAMEAAGVPAGKIQVIENGVDLERFGVYAHAYARHELGLDRPLVLSVGNLIPVKGHDLLLDAFASLGGDAELWIAGEGAERSRLEAQAERLGIAARVRFLGAVPHARLPLLYAAADVFALPSRNEGCPNVVLEATASGCPVAAMGVGHVPYLVEEGHNGLVATPGDAASLAAALRRLLKSPPTRDAVRATASRRTWDRVARRVVDVFERSIQAPSPPTAEGIPQCSGRF